ncbi:ARM repeat-containing protein, partial [Neocallimastix californiae]
KVKDILNELTLENSKILADQIVDIGIEDEETLKDIVKEIFDKAIDEPNFGCLYAKLCQYINEELPKKQKWVNIRDTNNNIFRKFLLNLCQEEFENNKDNRWSDNDDNEKPVCEMTDEEKLEYSRKQSKRIKKKRRSLGNIPFIGELYMCQIITQKIIRFCFRTLFHQLQEPDEESVEYLCLLFRTVGNKNLMEWSRDWRRYFVEMAELSKNKALPSRMRFMLMDIIELRKNKWKSKGNGPKTIAEIH